MSTTAVRSAIDDSAQIVVLPELVTSRYMFASRNEARSVAITIDNTMFLAGFEQPDEGFIRISGEYVQGVPPYKSLWSAAAAGGGAVVVGGLCEYDNTDQHGARLCNSATDVDGTGIRAVYRKTHLWDREKLWFASGDSLPPVIDTAFGRIGCRDLLRPRVP